MIEAGKEVNQWLNISCFFSINFFGKIYKLCATVAVGHRGLGIKKTILKKVGISEEK